MIDQKGGRRIMLRLFLKMSITEEEKAWEIELEN